MSGQDPIQSLESYFSSLPQDAGNEELLANILRAKGRRKQKMYGAACGFAVGAALTASLLLWAAVPSQKTSDKTLTAIERYQMINSGLVEAPSEKRIQNR